MAHLNRRQALAALAGAAALGQAAPRRRSQPNIVLILADDLGWGDLGCYGQRLVATPHLDALAAAGTRYTACYAGSTVCAPSRCCLLTGLHTGHARVRGNALVPLRPDEVTLPRLLQQAGYATGLFGKWGLGEPGSSGVPSRQGCDEFFGYLNQVHAHNGWPTHLWRHEQRVPLPNVVPRERPDGGGVASRRVAFANDLICDEALGFVDRQRHRPFWLCFTPTLPHANNEAGQDGMEVPDQGRYADLPWPKVQRDKAAAIGRLDWYVGRLVARLAEHRLLEDTLIVFSSDNGPHREGGADPEFLDSNGPLRGIKRDLYEGGIRVPGLVAWRGQVPAGRVCGEPWAHWDLLPTCAALAGTMAPDGLDGIDLGSLWIGGPPPQHPPFYWEFHEGGFSQAVRHGAWKAVRRKSRQASVELYDLVNDPAEAHDLAAAQPAITAALTRLLASARRDSAEFPVKG
ncbi:MAG: arylsulfatase [Fimbriimonadaceae bacterium]|nr:arylsulfatase [Fimbriimonadaceae bacterium]